MPSGMIENMSSVTLERLMYFECLCSGCRHHTRICGIHTVLLMSTGSEWYSLWFRLIGPQLCSNSGCEFKQSLAAVSKRGGQLHPPAIVSASFLGIQYSSSLLDKSDRSLQDWSDLDAIPGGKRLLRGILWSLVTGNHWCMTKYSFSTDFRNASGYWVV
jgi:hypothetical protein